MQRCVHYVFLLLARNTSSTVTLLVSISLNLSIMFSQNSCHSCIYLSCVQVHSSCNFFSMPLQMKRILTGYGILPPMKLHIVIVTLIELMLLFFLLNFPPFRGLDSMLLIMCFCFTKKLVGILFSRSLNIFIMFS